LTFAVLTQNKALRKRCKKGQDYFRSVGSRKICLLFGQHIADGMPYNVTSTAVEPTLKFQALAPAPGINFSAATS